MKLLSTITEISTPSLTIYEKAALFMSACGLILSIAIWAKTLFSERQNLHIQILSYVWEESHQFFVHLLIANKSQVSVSIHQVQLITPNATYFSDPEPTVFHCEYIGDRNSPIRTLSSSHLPINLGPFAGFSGYIGFNAIHKCDYNQSSVQYSIRICTNRKKPIHIILSPEQEISSSSL